MKRVTLNIASFYIVSFSIIECDEYWKYTKHCYSSSHNNIANHDKHTCQCIRQRTYFQTLKPKHSSIQNSHTPCGSDPCIQLNFFFLQTSPCYIWSSTILKKPKGGRVAPDGQGQEKKSGIVQRISTMMQTQDNYVKNAKEGIEKHK